MSHLTSITNKIDGISSRMIQVATAVEEQSITCEEINKNVTVIHDAAAQLTSFTTQAIDAAPPTAPFSNQIIGFSAV